jgi:Amt family ammonium transporter
MSYGGAAAALAGVLILGPRKGKYDKDSNSKPMLGANLPLATLGTFILWMGWFGFNGGSNTKRLILYYFNLFLIPTNF